ncbi:hypothetical protein E2562_023868 [Oryza meyeriana var. granulata]|uniref:Uncharacterized protein n=1 Tax=Oryza meyeriana var. granulata TaxID=110450 RepID=A0A6G1D763_9ORYZ|nr:hypothetical protein E2562_023868 [Oryza meyeriana var. granulata]
MVPERAACPKPTTAPADVDSGVRRPQSKPQFGSWREVVVRGKGSDAAVEDQAGDSWTEVRGRRRSTHPQPTLAEL